MCLWERQWPCSICYSLSRQGWSDKTIILWWGWRLKCQPDQTIWEMNWKKGTLVHIKVCRRCLLFVCAKPKPHAAAMKLLESTINVSPVLLFKLIYSAMLCLISDWPGLWAAGGAAGCPRASPPPATDEPSLSPASAAPFEAARSLLTFVAAPSPQSP